MIDFLKSPQGLCYSPRPAPLAARVKVAGLRWIIEEKFQTGKGLTGARDQAP